MTNQNHYDRNLHWQKELAAEEKQLVDLLKVVRRELSHAPPGHLQIKTKGGRTWYLQRYRTPEAKDVYLNEKNRSQVYLLAQKKYDERLLRVLENELAQVKKGKALQFSDLTKVYDTFPDTWRPFIEPHVLSDALFIEQWLKDMRMSASGEDFKSKSERLYDKFYNELLVPHVYEPSLYLEGYGTVRPDFAVLNVRTRQTFYHEHFGKMDDPDYCAKALAKLACYHRNGYFEGKNLLITMESSQRPTDFDEATLLFQEFLF
ncbi:MAG: hypothetical protein IKX83_00035 [Clostridia bacterium]|nr:hypothetical protein [Clostridia bacterium]